MPWEIACCQIDIFVILFLFIAIRWFKNPISPLSGGLILCSRWDKWHKMARILDLSLLYIWAFPGSREAEKGHMGSDVSQNYQLYPSNPFFQRQALVQQIPFYLGSLNHFSPFLCPSLLPVWISFELSVPFHLNTRFHTSPTALHTSLNFSTPTISLINTSFSRLYKDTQPNCADDFPLWNLMAFQIHSRILSVLHPPSPTLLLLGVGQGDL